MRQTMCVIMADEDLSDGAGGAGGVSVTLTMQLRRIKAEAEQLVGRERSAQLQLDDATRACAAAEAEAGRLLAARRGASKALSLILATAVDRGIR
jgi:hypothetical protein